MAQSPQGRALLLRKVAPGMRLRLRMRLRSKGAAMREIGAGQRTAHFRKVTIMRILAH